MYDRLLASLTHRLRGARAHASSVALALCLVALPHAAVAQSDNDIPCHPQFKLISPSVETEYTILNEILFEFTESHDAACQVDIALKQSPYYTCQQPQTQKTIGANESGDMRNQNEVRLICRYRQDGYYMAAPFTVRYLLEQEEVWRFDTTIPAIHILLTDLTQEEVDVRYSLKPWHRRLSPFFWLILLALIACAGAMFLYIRRVRKQQAADKAELQIEVEKTPPIELFNEKIAQLADLEPDGELAIKAYYDSLSEAIRRYLSDMLELPVMESTTGQLRSVLAPTLLDGQIDEIVRILQECDLIKFARMLASPTKRMALVRDTSHIISSIDAYIIAQLAAMNEHSELNNINSSSDLPLDAAVAAKVIDTNDQLDPSRSSQNNKKIFTPQNVWSSPTSEEFRKKYSSRDSDHDKDSDNQSNKLNIYEDSPDQYPAHDSVSVSPLKLMSIQDTAVQEPMNTIWSKRSSARRPVSSELSKDIVRLSSDNDYPINHRPSTVSVSITGRGIAISRDSDDAFHRSPAASSDENLLKTTLKSPVQLDTNSPSHNDIAPKNEPGITPKIADNDTHVHFNTPQPLHLTPSKEHKARLSNPDSNPVPPPNL